MLILSTSPGLSSQQHPRAGAWQSKTRSLPWIKFRALTSLFRGGSYNQVTVSPIKCYVDSEYQPFKTLQLTDFSLPRNLPPLHSLANLSEWFLAENLTGGSATFAPPSLTLWDQITGSLLTLVEIWVSWALLVGIFGALITGSVAEGPQRCPTRLRCTPASALPSVPPESLLTATHTHPHPPPAWPWDPSLPHTHSIHTHTHTPNYLCFITSKRVSLIKVTFHVGRTPNF